MRNRLSLSLFPLLFALLAVRPIALFGQPRPSSDKPHASSEREALKLLNEALADAQALKLAENRLWAQSLAVAALWRHDERRARALLAALTDELKRLAAERQNEGNRQQHFACGQLRQETAQMLAPRDLALARSFLIATRPPADPLNEYTEPQTLHAAAGATRSERCASP